MSTLSKCQNRFRLINSDTVSVAISSNDFKVYSDEFQKNHDFLAAGTDGTIWDGYIGGGTQHAASNFKIHSSQGFLHLSSASTKWDGGKPQGPFLYKLVKGDFSIRARVDDLRGLKDGGSPGTNEAGIMVRMFSPEGDSLKGEHLVQNGVLLGWNVGNLVTDLKGTARPQFSNGLGKNFYRFLQIMKEGSMFYMQGSRDGKVWYELPGSPLSRPDLDGKTLQIGLYQASFSDASGYTKFGKVEIVQPLE